MMLTALFAIIIVLLLLAIRLCRGEILAPSVLFLTGFTACAGIARLFSSTWDFNLRFNTFCVIASGLVLFVLFDVLALYAIRGSKSGSGDSKRWHNGEKWKLPVNRSAIIAVLALQVVSLLWMLHVLQVTYPSDSIAGSIRLYNDARKFSGNVVQVFPRPLSITRNVCGAFVYLLIYQLAQNLSLREKEGTALLVASFAFACISSFATGGRMPIIGYIFYLCASYYLLRCRIVGCSNLLTVRSFVCLAIVAVILPEAFQASLLLVGRPSPLPVLEYLAVYVGAEIPNLDIFLQGDFPRETGIWGYMTLQTSIQWLGQKMGIDGWVYALDIPFQQMNGHGLGNVYTCFYSPIYDFGYIGLLLFIPVMAVISRFLYEKVLCRSGGRASCIWLIAYVLCGYTLLMSFFSNIFYESFFCIGIVRTMCYTALCYLLYTRVTMGARNSVSAAFLRNRTTSESECSQNGRRSLTLIDAPQFQFACSAPLTTDETNDNHTH